MGVLITGGSGFLGKFLVLKFKEPVILDLKESKHGIFEFGSVTSWSDVVEVFKKHKIEGVIHAAAELSAKAERSHFDAFRVNVVGTLNILEACRLFDVEKVVFTSSHSVYGMRSIPLSEMSIIDPQTFYGATKACSEILGNCYASSYGIDFRTVRLPVLIGPYREGLGASVTFSSFIDDIFHGKSPVISLPPETKLPVLYVKDAAELIAKLYSKDRVSKPVFNAGGIALTLAEMVEATRSFFPEFSPKFEVDEVSREIARKWTLMTDFAERSGILEKYRRIEELKWEIKWDNAQKIIEDHIKTLEEGL